MIAQLAGRLHFPVVQQQVARVRQVVRHQPPGKLGVSLLNRKHNRPMKLECMLQIDKL